jgi:predicted nuclease of predicted toxin-antitoxin system
VIRFHLDQHVANAVAQGLRLRGIDVTTTHDAGLQDADDLAHIAYAAAQGRVIFTQDDDFLRHHHSGVSHAGIVYSKQGTRTVGQIVRHLKLLHDCLDDEADMVGQVEYL